MAKKMSMAKAMKKVEGSKADKAQDKAMAKKMMHRSKVKSAASKMMGRSYS